MEDTLVVVTVGTSLVENTGGKQSSRLIGGLNGACEELKKGTQPTACSTQPPNHRRVLNLLLELDEEQQVGYRASTEDDRYDRLPQELSYLYLLLKQERTARFDVHLLASSSRRGEACALTIKDYLEKRRDDDGANGGSTWGRLSSITWEAVDGLQTESPDEFRRKGAGNLISKIRQLTSSESDTLYKRVIVNATGGFKSLIPFVTMGVAFAEVPCEMHYLFAETPHIIRMPTYPIGLDFPLYHREANMLHGVEHWTEYKEYLSPRMRNLAEGDANQQADLKRVFRDAYTRQRAVDPFQEYSKSVVGRLVRNDEYRRRLVDLIEQRGATIWLGDKITMAAGHADHHHHDLLEIAELIIPPLGDGFLNEKEEFVLLAAVLLHDCGHALGALPRKDGKPVELFPSEVRDLHHFLTFHRLTNDGHAKAIGWDPEAELANEVAHACRYHRKSTGWDKQLRTLGKTICPFIDTEIVPPAQAVSEYNLNCKVDLPKLVALLRLIDGCDNQNRRVGPAARVETLEQLFRAEKEVHAQSFRALRRAALDYAGQHTCLPGADILRAWRVDDSEPVAGVTRNEKWWRMRVLLATNDDIDPVWRHLWTETARAVDEVAVRDRQYIHFLKHQVVRSIVVRPVFDGSDFVRFDIQLVPDEDPNLQPKLDNTKFATQYCQEMNGANTLRDWIRTDMEGEMCPAAKKYVADKRKQRAFEVNFQWASPAQQTTP